MLRPEETLGTVLDCVSQRFPPACPTYSRISDMQHHPHTFPMPECSAVSKANFVFNIFNHDHREQSHEGGERRTRSDECVSVDAHSAGARSSGLKSSL